MAGALGLAWGDPAAHVLDVLAGLGLTLDSCADKAPDHLAVLMELLAYVVRTRPVEEVRAFCGDHLDWIPELREAAKALEIPWAPAMILETVERLVSVLAASNGE